MEKDLILHIEFDINQLESLWDKLALYPELQDKTRKFIDELKSSIQKQDDMDDDSDIQVEKEREAESRDLDYQANRE